jgi:tetratricopeptide (TPR) repeat protein
LHSQNRNFFCEDYILASFCFFECAPVKGMIGLMDIRKQALKLAARDYTGLVLMAKANIMQEKFKESIPYLDKAIDVYPQEAQAGQLRGVVESKLGNKQAALEYFHACA